MPVTIRPADPDDAPDVLRLLRLAVPPAVRPGTPLGPRAARTWIRDRITQASSGGAASPRSDRASAAMGVGTDDVGAGEQRVGARQRGVPSPCAYRVAVAGRRIVGAAEWRDLDGLLFLNSIAVDPLARGHGVGTRLLRDGIRMWPSLLAMRLDVFDAMPQAHQWYTQFGFSETGRRAWVRFPPDLAAEPGAALPVVWENEAEATSRHQQHGCSMLRLHVPASLQTDHAGPETHTVGRIGRSMFRITRRRTLQHAAIRAFLHRLNPSRHVLYLSPPEGSPLAASSPVSQPPPDPTDPLTGARGTHLATSIRMHHASPTTICA